MSVAGPLDLVAILNIQPMNQFGRSLTPPPGRSLTPPPRGGNGVQHLARPVSPIGIVRQASVAAPVQVSSGSGLPRQRSAPRLNLVQPPAQVNGASLLVPAANAQEPIQRQLSRMASTPTPPCGSLLVPAANGQEPIQRQLSRMASTPTPPGHVQLRRNSGSLRVLADHSPAEARSGSVRLQRSGTTPQANGGGSARFCFGAPVAGTASPRYPGAPASFSNYASGGASASQAADSDAAAAARLRGQSAVHRSHTPPRTHVPRGTGRVIRVLCYGDSNTSGFQPGTGEHTPYADQLSEFFAMAGLEVAVTACGLNGLMVSEMLLEAQTQAVSDLFGRIGKGLVRMLDDEGHPDLVILMVGTNDIGRFRGVEGIVADLLRMQALCWERKVPCVLLGPPAVPESKRMSNTRRQLVQQMKTWTQSVPGVLAFYDAEDLVPRQPAFWNSDGFHLTPKGHAELGRRLAPLVLPLLMNICQAGQPEMPSANQARSLSQPPSASMAQPLWDGRLVNLGGSFHIGAGHQAAHVPTIAPQPGVSPRIGVSPRLGGSARFHQEAGVSPRLAPRLGGSARFHQEAGQEDLYRDVGSRDNPLNVGDKVEVWSKSGGAWCMGWVVQVANGLIETKMMMPNGSFARKVLPIGHPQLRSHR